MSLRRYGSAVRVAASLAALAGACLVLGACSGSSNFASNIFGSNSSPGPTAAGVNNDAAPGGDLSDLSCPSVAVRTGASTLTIGSKPGQGEPAPLEVRYQGTVVNTARECHLNAGLFSIKVGVEGRVIAGPAGGPGTIEVPLRIAVVREGANPVTVVTKLIVIPVTIAEGTDHATFTHVEPDLAFTVPQPASALDSYVVYVGFDPLGAKPQKKAPARKPRAKAKQS